MLEPLDSDTDVLTEHTHLFYANSKGLSIHILINIGNYGTYIEKNCIIWKTGIKKHSICIKKTV